MTQKDVPAIIIEHIEACLLPKLEKDLDEIDYHPEFRTREKVLPEKIKFIINLLAEKDLRKYANISEVLGYLIILLEELKSSGAWNSNQSTEFIDKLNTTFSGFYRIPIDGILSQSIFETQLVFDHCIKILHNKTAVGGYRRYPSLVAVYCALLKNVKNYKVSVNPPLTFPLALQMVDDFDSILKIKGLECCLSIMEVLKTKHFHDGNYYLVIFDNLTKEISDKDVEVTSLGVECTLQLARIMPPEMKISKLDELYGLTLEQMLLEPSLYRKAVLIQYTKVIIKLQGSKCINRSSFKGIICDNLDFCTDENAAEILLFATLECLEVWIQYCWFSWQFSSDQKMLMILFKVLYTCQDQQIVTKLHNIIVTLINISSKEEQKKIRNCLETSSFPNKEYQKRLNKIKREIHV